MHWLERDHNIGATTIDPMEVADERAEERFMRHTDSDFGSGSHIIDVNAYASIPVYARIPIQVLGLIVLPFSWMINGPDKALASQIA